MKNLLIALALIATPTTAMAAPNSNFVGPRIEATAGLDDLTQNVRSADINYGASAGVDLPLGDRFTIGAEVNADNFFHREDLGASARLGLALSDNLLVHGNVGYASFRNLDGLRVGGGLEISTNTPLYLHTEYRYSDFENGVGRHSGLVGVGLRF